VRVVVEGLALGGRRLYKWGRREDRRVATDLDPPGARDQAVDEERGRGGATAVHLSAGRRPPATTGSSDDHGKSIQRSVRLHT
jgi:hypothetical protein